jgi:hypothetical protein
MHNQLNPCRELLKWAHSSMKMRDPRLSPGREMINHALSLIKSHSRCSTGCLGLSNDKDALTTMRLSFMHMYAGSQAAFAKKQVST